MAWVFGFLLLHFTALGLMKWRESDEILGAYIVAFLLLYFGGGGAFALIKYLTGA